MSCRLLCVLGLYCAGLNELDWNGGLVDCPMLNSRLRLAQARVALCSTWHSFRGLRVKEEVNLGWGQ